MASRIGFQAAPLTAGNGPGTIAPSNGELAPPVSSIVAWDVTPWAKSRRGFLPDCARPTAYCLITLSEIARLTQSALLVEAATVAVRSPGGVQTRLTPTTD